MSELYQMHLSHTSFVLILVLVSNLFIGCSGGKQLAISHKMDIRQGNTLSQQTITQLKPGMTKEEVEFLLGPPSITDTFHANRWDYLYSLEKRGERTDFKHIILYFQGNLLEKIETPHAQ